MRLWVVAVVTLLLTIAPAATSEQQSAAPLWFDITAAAIGDTKYWTNKVEIADLNSDGRPDLLFANGGDYSTPGRPEPNQVYFNAGPGARFTEMTEPVLGPTPDLARVIKARDLNGDGHTDIVVGTTYQTQSRLFLGSGKGRFAEVTQTHLPQMPLSVGDLEIGDVDADGDLDLVLADWGPGNNMTNDGGVSRLWTNDGTGRFTDAAAERMPQTKIRFSWDLELADVDNDGDLDLLVSCKRCPGSALFRNDGAGVFTDATVESGLGPATLPFVGFGVAFFDFDNSGSLDLAIANGHVIDNTALFRSGSTHAQRKLLFRNLNGRRLMETGREAGPGFSAAGVGRTLVTGDVDNDGDVDVLVTNNGAAPELLRNGTSGGHAIVLRLLGAAGSRDALGARVGVTAAGRTQVREVKSGSSYLGQGDLRVHVGLGAVTAVDHLDIRWPSGRSERVATPAVDQIVTVQEGRGVTASTPFARRPPREGTSRTP